MHTRKLAIVVQPNISLMDNQVQVTPTLTLALTLTLTLTLALTFSPNPNPTPTSSQPRQELNALAAKCGEAPWASAIHCEDKSNEHVALDGRYRVVCVSEQRALAPNFMRQLSGLHKEGKLLLIAVDEAHIISECSPGYRPLYRQLAKLRQVAQAVPFLALTATATPEVRADIVTSLMLRQPLMAIESIYRPELYLAREPRPQGGPKKVVARIAAGQKPLPAPSPPAPPRSSLGRSAKLACLAAYGPTPTTNHRRPHSSESPGKATA